MSLNAYCRFKTAMNCEKLATEDQFNDYKDGECWEILQVLNPDLLNFLNSQNTTDFVMTRSTNDIVTLITYHVCYNCEDTLHRYEQSFIIENNTQNILVKLTDQQTMNAELKIFNNGEFFDPSTKGTNYPKALENEQTQIEFPSSKRPCGSLFSQTRLNDRVMTEKYEQGMPLSSAFTSEDTILNICSHGALRILYNDDTRVSKIQLVHKSFQVESPLEENGYHADGWFDATMIAKRIDDEITEICRVIKKNINEPQRQHKLEY